jgi:hypothetical protein
MTVISAQLEMETLNFHSLYDEQRSIRSQHFHLREIKRPGVQRFVENSPIQDEFV